MFLTMWDPRSLAPRVKFYFNCRDLKDKFIFWNYVPLQWFQFYYSSEKLNIFRSKLSEEEKCSWFLDMRLSAEVFFSRKSDSTFTNVRPFVCLFVRLSVCPSVRKQNPSTASNHNPSSFIIHHLSFILHH